MTTKQRVLAALDTWGHYQLLDTGERCSSPGHPHLETPILIIACKGCLQQVGGGIESVMKMMWEHHKSVTQLTEIPICCRFQDEEKILS